MSNTRRHEPLHLPPETHLPAVPESTPAVDMLKQLLEQMLENERRRLRNEYIRMSTLFLILLALATGSGWWLAHSLLSQLRQERQKNQAAIVTAAGLSAKPSAVMAGETRSEDALSGKALDKEQLLALLKTRTAEASNLQKRLEQTQSKALDNAELETETFPFPEQSPPSIAPIPPSSVTITTSNHLVLRLPIPKP